MSDKQFYILLGIAAVAGVVAYDSAKKAGAIVVEKLNPLDSGNIFYSGVNNLGSAITGTDNFNLGSWLYDVTN